MIVMIVGGQTGARAPTITPFDQGLTERLSSVSELFISTERTYIATDAQVRGIKL